MARKRRVKGRNKFQPFRLGLDLVVLRQGEVILHI
jgi:hypothetical protein